MKRLFLVLLCLFLLPTVVGAQIASPLIVLINGDYWVWRGDAAPPPALTVWGYNEPGVMAPDGLRVAYVSLAQVVVEAFARGAGQAGGALPSNIWVIDANGGGVRVADQPANAAFMAEGAVDNGLIRSTPAWSPDGTRLAWVEQTYPTPIDSIVVCQVADCPTSARPIVSGLPPSAGVPGPKEILWGQNGIVIRDVQANPNGGLIDLFSVYTPDGAIIASFPVGDSGRFLTYYALMTVDGVEKLGVLFSDATWQLYELTSGAAQVATGIPELYSTLAPATSLALAPYVNEFGGFSWRLLTPDGQAIAEFLSPPYFVPQRYALSPDGQAVAYSDYLEPQRVFSDVVNLWQNGAVSVMPSPVDFPLVGGLLWGPMGWRVRSGVG